MTANVAGFTLAIIGGADLADKVDPRVVELSLSEKREGDADTLSITLQNADGKLAIPETGVQLEFSLGWKAGGDVIVGLVDKGIFTVDEVGQEGPPDVITIRARSADLTGSYSKRRTQSWRDTTLGAVLREIAARGDAQARIDPALAASPIDALEQEGKSDMAFIRDLGRRYDAIATWKGGRLLFMPIGASATAAGTPLPSVALTRQDGWRWAFRQQDREEHDGAEAQWQDQDAGKRRTVTVGGENRRKLKRIYPSEAQARQAAQAAARRDARAPVTFEYDLARADCALQPDMPVSLEGWSERIDGVSWLVESVETRLSAAGLEQSLKLESG